MGKKKGCFRIKRNKSTASQRSHNNQPASSTVGVEREPQSEQTIQSVESDPDFMIPPITVTTARNLQLETLPKMRSFFNASDAPISAVTVYLDRAEISRILRFKAEPGEYEVVIQQIRSPVDLASLRVEGHGPAVITDVNLSNNYIEKSQTSDTNQKEKRLRDELQRLNEQKCIEESEEARLKKHLEFWKECMESLASNAFAAKKKTMSPAISDTGNSMIEFLGLQTNETRKLDEKLLQQRRVLNTLNESIETAKKNLNEYTSTSSQNTWNILITLIAEAKGELELNVKYIVHNASWSPKYDVRVASDTKKLSVTYYGLISQRTNEDWSDVQICLSTALPAVGANVPELGTKQLSFASPYTNSIPPPGSSRSMLRGAVNFLHKREASEYFDVGEEIAEHADGVSWARPMHTAVAKVIMAGKKRTAPSTRVASPRRTRSARDVASSNTQQQPKSRPGRKRRRSRSPGPTVRSEVVVVDQAQPDWKMLMDRQNEKIQQFIDIVTPIAAKGTGEPRVTSPATGDAGLEIESLADGNRNMRYREDSSSRRPS
ncbi:uncharacterized protein LOC129595336 isoform X2 [Paramacrobiotus metropolitanus]|uniref:uncharacterized protein LOC129595336 isoform X2 n=1 Tax=Paramacrobiotus metropolitanus TaxID=2943436 RepID=UPI002446105B|nr:uncharacterized protein LOC129595336 isoform X2 [Paramacrobiotus metropolitanus]